MSASAAASVSVVLVHGGFVDGSGWQGVYNSLRQQGYRVGIVQNPTISLDDDVAVTKRVIAAQPGRVVLVGHSYGGVVITQAGNDPKVAGLVYIAAFAPDKGESVATLIANPAPGAPVPPILPPQDGFLLLDREKFAASFAADVPADLADFMANSQVPWGVQALEGKVSEASWKSKPSWYLVATDDRMIPPPAQQFMSKRGLLNRCSPVERSKHLRVSGSPSQTSKVLSAKTTGQAPHHTPVHKWTALQTCAIQTSLDARIQRRRGSGP
jgi:pimeloyl-ACP methyl ester carboxylesterase